MILPKPKICESAFAQAKGLMFSKRIKDESLVFVFKKPKIVKLHMWFVFCPIDVLFLDEKKKVVEMKQHLRPFTFYTPKKEAKYVVELPETTITKQNIKIGSVVEF